jgi:hypothetical protein
VNAMDWEIYTTGDGYRAELLGGANPRPLATIAGRNRAWLHIRMLIAQWWHR